jgi:hypothetical protein
MSLAHRTPRRILALLAALALPAPALAQRAELPRTRGERTEYRETSHYDDVVEFLRALEASGHHIALGEIGRTSEGRAIPYAIASRPLVTTPEAARRLGRPIVYVQGNIHAGEVEGKEALLMLLRDLTTAAGPNVLDSLVLVAVPIYNADGNERFAPQDRNRRAQNGPEMVGTRANAMGLDLNRDYIKADAPETRASLDMFRRWDPDLFVDLHTTDGSYHGYALTYSPSLNVAAYEGAFDGGGYARDSLLPVLRRRMRERDHFEVFDYGNFVRSEEGATLGGTTPQGWETYEHFPRYGTNYYALRGRVSILSEAFSHDPFERRVASTYAFVHEILSLAAERGRQLQTVARRATAAAPTLRQVSVRARLTTHPDTQPVIWEELERTGDSTRAQPGVPLGVRRTGRFHTTPMPVYDRFEPTLRVDVPWAWALAPGDSAGARLLAAHGVAFARLAAPCAAEAERFIADSTIVAPRAFQNRRLVRLEGRWQRDSSSLPAGTILVRTAQPLGVLATYLLAPESDDGFTAWDIDARATANAATLPTRRVMRAPSSGCRTSAAR